MDTVAERIRSLIKSSGLSMRKLADHIGVSNVSLSQWANGRNRPADAGLEALCSYFNVTPAWLLYGDGNSPEGQTICISNDTIAIPYLSATASCGLREDVLAVPSTLITFIRVTYAFIRTYCATASPRSLQIVAARGDSMSPTLNDGDAVIIDISQKDVTQDGLYAVQLGGAILIKRIQLTPKGLLLLSDNPAYSPLTVTKDDNLNVIGRAYAGLQIRRLI